MQAINMWNIDAGLPQLDKYTYSEDANIVAGSCLGIGLCCCCIRSELDPAFALLVEHVSSDKPAVQKAAIMALGLAYAGTQKEDVQESLLPLVDADESSVEVVAHCCLALGLVFAGTPSGASLLLRSYFCATERLCCCILAAISPAAVFGIRPQHYRGSAPCSADAARIAITPRFVQRRLRRRSSPTSWRSPKTS